VNRSIPGRVYYGWLVVASGFVISFVGIGTAFYTFGSFLTALAAEFGWSRGEISLAFMFLVVGLGVVSPFVGRWTDRYGAKKVIVPSTLVMGLSLLLLRYLTNSFFHFYALYFLMGCGGAALITVVPVYMASRWFRRKRGLALGVTYVGGGLGGVVLASLSGYLITTVGFRNAYTVLGLLIWAAVFLLSVPLIKGDPAELGLLPDGEKRNPKATDPGFSHATLLGMNLTEAGKTVNFWLLWFALFLTNTGVSAMNQHLVPLLTDKGFSLEGAAATLSLLAVVSIVGRLISGYLMDKLVVKYLAMAFYVSLALGLLALTLEGDLWTIYLSTVLLGLAVGAEFDMIAYMIGEYFGFSSFGEIFSWIYIASLLGGVIGPVATGYIFDWTGSYDLALILSAVLALVAVVSVSFLQSPGGLYRREEALAGS
jgi:MFS family permease